MRDNVQIAFGTEPIGPRLDLFLVRSGLCAAPLGLRRAGLRRALALESLSDAQLAARGLTRSGILPHVFRDVTG